MASTIAALVERKADMIAGGSLVSGGAHRGLGRQRSGILARGAVGKIVRVQPR